VPLSATYYAAGSGAPVWRGVGGRRQKMDTPSLGQQPEGQPNVINGLAPKWSKGGALPIPPSFGGSQISQHCCH